MKTIEIGKVLKPQGIKGEIKVLPITEDVTRFKALETVTIGGQEYEVTGAKVREDGVYLTLKGLDDRNSVEPLRNQYLSIPREKAIKLPEDAWFITDLIGCCVCDDKGKDLGSLTDVFQNGSADVYSLDGGKLMFPALKRVLKSVDIENKRIVLWSEALSEVAVYED